MYFPESNIIVKNQDFVLVLTKSGQPPRIILSIPHDGLPKTNFHNILTPRKSGAPDHDINVWQIAKDIFFLGQSSHTNISAVRCLMPRLFVDVNRRNIGLTHDLDGTPTETAYDNPQYSAVFTRYHTEIKSLITRAVHRYGHKNVFLLDMHGCSATQYDLILRIGKPFILEEIDFSEYLADSLKAKNYSVLVDDDDTDEPKKKFFSDYTVKHYSQKFHINTCQIDISSRLRGDMSRLGHILARDLHRVLESYSRRS